MLTFVLFVVVFGGMVFVHEFGHFIVARLFKIPVEEFGFGFPPRVATLFKWQGTEFTLNALPLGGFVRPRGENDPDVPDGLAAANPWKRLGVLFAGPLMNLLTAIVVLSFVIVQAGIPVPGTVKVAQVTSDSPAEKAGLQDNDIIKAVNGTPVSDVDATRILIRKNLDKPVTLLIERNGRQLTIIATPLSSRTVEEGALGVALGYPTRPAGLDEAVTGGVTLTGLQALNILYLPIGLIQGAIAPDEARLVGLKGIYDFFGMAIQRDTQTRAQASQQSSQPESGGAPVPTPQPSNYVLELVAMLSISLGGFNLFPIPALDGGRILFTLPEILFRRRIPPRFENAVNTVAFVLLIGLMAVVNVMDFVNPISTKLP